MDWGVIGVVVGIIGVMVGALGVWYAWRQRSRRELSYDEVLNVPLFRVVAPPLARNRLQVLFDGQPVKDARLVVIKLQNTGNQPIRPDDQLTPITFVFEGATILWVEITGTTPDYLKPVLAWGQGPDRAELMLTPMLFNVGYGVELSVMLQGFRGDVPAPQAQIVGVNEIVRYLDPRDRAAYKYLRSFVSLAVGILAIFVAGALSALSPGKPSPSTPSVMSGVVTVVAGALGVLVLTALFMLLREATISWQQRRHDQQRADARAGRRHQVS